MPQDIASCPIHSWVKDKDQKWPDFLFAGHKSLHPRINSEGTQVHPGQNWSDGL